jgi:ubiquitin conjugation factor E4 B
LYEAVLIPSKPVGPAEFLPLLLAVTPDTSSDDPVAGVHGCLAAADLLPFLNDLASGFTDDTLADVLTPTLSLFFQEWFKITPSPDLLGSDWRRYLGAISLLAQVKDIAASVRPHRDLC